MSLTEQPAGKNVRSRILTQANVTIARALHHHPCQSILLVGQDQGKLGDLLGSIKGDAQRSGLSVLDLGVGDNTSAEERIVQAAGLLLLSLREVDSAREECCRAISGLAGFCSVRELGTAIPEIGALSSFEPGLADSGDLECDFIELIGLLSRAARSANSAVGVFWGDLHLQNRETLGALIGGLHRCAQEGASVFLLGSGMPQLRGQVTEVKSYAERMFVFYDVT